MHIRTLLPELRLSLLDGRDDHVAYTGIRETVKVRASAERLNDEERLGTAVVRAVEYGARGQTESQTELVSRCTRAWLATVKRSGVRGWYNRKFRDRWHKTKSNR